MANRDHTRGLVPVSAIDGSPCDKLIMKCFVPATDSTAIFIGDAVKLAGSADTDGKYPTVAQVAAGDAIFGVCVGVTDIVATDPIHRVASTATYIHVVPAEDVIFRIQEDSVGGALAATDVGSVADLIVGTGDATTGLSAMEIDSSTAATGSSAQVRILGLAPEEGNDIGNNAEWLVIVNESQIADSSNGV